jgi:hypothetical protein
MTDIIQIPLAQIDSSGIVSDRLDRIRAAHDCGIALPPVIVYPVGSRYQKIDGAHRIHVARERNHASIAAVVVQSHDETHLADAWRILREWPYTPLPPEREEQIQLSEIARRAAAEAAYTHERAHRSQRAHADTKKREKASMSNYVDSAVTGVTAALDTLVHATEAVATNNVRGGDNRQKTNLYYGARIRAYRKLVELVPILAELPVTEVAVTSRLEGLVEELKELKGKR